MRTKKAGSEDRYPTDRRTDGTARSLVILAGLVLIPGLAGCGTEIRELSETTGSMPAADAPATPPARTPGVATKSGEEPSPELPRKIIYNATVELLVENLSTVEEQLTRLIKESGGYVAEMDITSHAHLRHSGTWKIRIPVDRFPSFLAAVGKLGELQRSRTDSQDVSQEYYDLGARIINKQQEETRLKKHLDESTGKLEDILAVEREISRVRGEVEQMQGRLKYLTNLSALSTVTITANELKDYTPPVSPTLTTEIGRTFRVSLAALAAFGKGVLLFAVALGPWVPLIALAGWIIRRVFRRRSRI